MTFSTWWCGGAYTSDKSARPGLCFTWVNQLGVDPMDTIRAATYWPAVMMKVEKDYGSISEGKFADIIALKGDVLRHIDLLQRVDMIIKHGKRMK